MTQIRQAAVSGHFYPSDATELDSLVRRMLDEAPARSGPAPKALIVPHAGYIYSGTVAATAYARVLAYRDQYRRVVLLGPCHRVAIRGVALSSAQAFRTPLGDIRLEETATLGQDQVAVFVSDDAHRLEHSLEVQLPFLQNVLESFVLLPLAVGEISPQSVAQVIEELWGGAETLLVISSDLSHYLAYEEARERDLKTCAAIEQLDTNRINQDDACGAIPVSGLLIAARRRGLRVITLDLRNSGDTAGGRGQVVGYGAWILVED
jgi:AmmeMemoRadiSam system protein B